MVRESHATRDVSADGLLGVRDGAEREGKVDFSLCREYYKPDCAGYSRIGMTSEGGWWF